MDALRTRPWAAMGAQKVYIPKMEKRQNTAFGAPSDMPPPPRQWDARLARQLVTPLKDTWVMPNHLTTLRLLLGLAGALALAAGGYGWTNVGALLIVISNFVDHTDGELARISGKSSRIGHFYDLAADALVTIGLFVGMGMGVAADAYSSLPAASAWLGWMAGLAVALIFFLRMRIEERAGKAGTRQARLGGFETEDVLYLIPLVTLLDGVTPACFGSHGDPLRHDVMNAAVDLTARDGAGVAHDARTQVDLSIRERVAALDAGLLREAFDDQGAFLFLDEFLAPDVTVQLVDAVHRVEGEINRNYLPGHKQGGSVSRYTIDRLAPVIAQLYRSPALIEWLEALCADRLLACPETDPHAYALYFYTKPGDHIGWHYDTSYYKGRRYTLLLGVIDASSCKLEYRLHTREPGMPVTGGAVRLPPGGLVFFDGDKLHHRITPLGASERRVSLTFEYAGVPAVDRNADPRMTRAAVISLTIGASLFVALLVWQGIAPLAAALSAAGSGLLLVAAFHWLPVVVDAAAIRVLVGRRVGVTMREVVLARWGGESVNSLLPAGQIGGPLLMVRHLAQRGLSLPESAAVMTVSTTWQTIAQVVFALLGLAVFAANAAQGALGSLRTPLLAASAGFAILLYGFYLAQRRCLFGRLSRVMSKLSAGRDWSALLDRADAVDVHVAGLYRQPRTVAASFVLSLAGWIVGTGEVWLILQLIGHPVGWVDALLLESVGQAIRGAAFMIPGSLGVQEGGYLLLAPLAGLPPDAAFALSLAKRAREILLGVPGLVYLHFSERGWQRRRAARMPAAD
ncbi:hypothetical protein DFQ28_011042 [Apophysomyces sp. BC1034]|nr:hypothetical protein DFQ28_011042 [Apophysomyces sp. BC1034]